MFEKSSAMLALIAVALAMVAGLAGLVSEGPTSVWGQGEVKERRLDPRAWGSDHVGKPLPDYMTGDECLFCHREKIGPRWLNNPHQKTVRMVESDHPAMETLQQSRATRQFSREVQLMMGDDQHVRFLKRSTKYGKLEMLSVGWRAGDPQQAGKLVQTVQPHWNKELFGSSCAGCHMTAVDSQQQTFSSVSLDCVTCHGVTDASHSRDTSKVLLSKQRRDPPRVVVSICGQCHIRSGQSRSTKLPFANNFVPGDNLFRDFQVDWSNAHLQQLNPADRHVLENVRDVVLYGKTTVTCLSCHQVHTQTSAQHQQLPNQRICLNCHHATGPKSNVRTFRVVSKRCEFGL